MIIDVEENKKIFIGLCRSCAVEGMDELLMWLAHTDWYTAPASSRFHLACAGGLVAHSLSVYERLLELADMYAPGEYEPEDLIISALFHDLCKVENYKKGSRNVKNPDTGKWETVPCYNIDQKFHVGHSQGSVILLQRFIKLKLPVMYAILGHMGAWDTSIKGGDRYVSEIHDECHLAVLLHMADYISSKMFEEVEDGV